MKFKHTNFKLNDGTYTISEDLPEFDEKDPVYLGIEKIINTFFNNIEMLSFVDYGCYEGAYSIALALRGLKGTGIDAREENINKCKYLKQKLERDKLSFIKTDLNNFDPIGKVNITLCLGLLYHLENPHKFIQMMANSTNQILFLHTHYATHLKPYQPARLSDICEHEGLKGRWYTEHAENATKEQIETSCKSSYSNKKSFWIEKSHLIWALKNAGFRIILEQHDWIKYIRTNNYVNDLDRNMFICIK